MPWLHMWVSGPMSGEGDALGAVPTFSWVTSSPWPQLCSGPALCGEPCPSTAPMLQLPFHPPSHEAPLRAVSSVRATPPASR